SRGHRSPHRPVCPTPLRRARAAGGPPAVPGHAARMSRFAEAVCSEKISGQNAAGELRFFPRSNRGGPMIRRRAVLVVLFFAIPLPSRAALAVGCVGACSDPNMVQISDLLIGVDIALGLTRVSRCVAFDANNDGNVNVVELLQGVQNAIEGCVTP